jgi:SAM-dependent methyltransferase
MNQLTGADGAVTGGTDADLLRVFRDSVAASPISRERAGWLTSYIERVPSEVARIGLDYIGFANTAARALGWHKAHKMAPFTPFGWPLDPSTLSRVRRGIDRMMAEFLDDPAISPAAAAVIRDFDRETLARYTAIDARFQTVTPAPIRSVLDFGSGIGRASLIWSFDREDVALVSVDATESLYLLQHELYRRMYGGRLIELLGAPEGTVASLAGGTVTHVPAWMMDRTIPSASIDLIVCVQVLQELTEPALSFALQQFRRIIRPQGVLYIRDKEFWIPEHRVRVGRALLANGWHLAFRYPGSEGSDIHGIPRLWVYTGADYSNYFRFAARLKRMFLPSYSLSYRSWRDIGLPL